jgi:hypothetical protein
MLNDSGDGLRIVALFCLCICKASRVYYFIFFTTEPSLGPG